ncbi:MAG: Outer membrane protein assembly factor BamD [Thermoanaerobaculia bacterium]|nr:Outer membrane protein assembly factor BamD [Thermoanaerobaculia bacterium]
MIPGARTFRVFLVSASTLGALTACVGEKDIQNLHQHLNDVEGKVDSLAKQSSSKEEVARLNESLSNNVATLLRSNADLGEKFSDITKDLQSLASKLEDANRRLAQLSQQLAETQARMAGSVPGAAPELQGPPPGGPLVAPVGAGSSPGQVKAPSPADLFRQAASDYQKGQFDLAREGFQDYIDTYPKTDVSDDALYWIGECHLAQKKPREAINTFENLLRVYPASDKLPAAYLKKAMAHLDLDEKAQAIKQLQLLVHKYPASDEAKIARQRLKALAADTR